MDRNKNPQWNQRLKSTYLWWYVTAPHRVRYGQVSQRL